MADSGANQSSGHRARRRARGRFELQNWRGALDHMGTILLGKRNHAAFGWIVLRSRRLYRARRAAPISRRDKEDRRLHVDLVLEVALYPVVQVVSRQLVVDREIHTNVLPHALRQRSRFQQDRLGADSDPRCAAEFVTMPVTSRNWV